MPLGLDRLEDSALVYPVLAGLLLLLAAHIWVAVKAAGVSAGWGVATLLVPGVGLAFTVMHFRRARGPFALGLVGLLLVAVPIVYVVGFRKLQDTAVEERKPAEVPRTTPGTAPAEPPEPAEERLTLTGAKREEYAKLKAKKTWAVVQWANPDVTDKDVEALHGCALVRELDLSGTQITDEALHVLEDMPKLAILRLARTGITAEGFEEHLANVDTLMTLDLRGTKVPPAAARAWQAKKPGRKLVI